MEFIANVYISAINQLSYSSMNREWIFGKTADFCITRNVWPSLYRLTNLYQIGKATNYK